MQNNEKLLVVVDPTVQELYTLERVQTICKNRGAAHYPEVTLFISAAVGKGLKTADAIESRSLSWVSDLQQVFIEMGVKCSSQISWDADWAKAVLKFSEALGVDSIILPHRCGDSKQNLSDDFWYLVRNTTIPVSLLGESQTDKRKVILVCRNTHEASLTDINTRTFEFAKKIAAANHATIHIVSSYPDSLNYPDRGSLLNDTELPNEQLHIKSGSPQHVIAEVAQDIDADLIMLAVSRRNDLKTALMGRKMEKIIKGSNRDMILVV
ncbi:MAG: universal stress protein [Spongiibacteraceae bacterium]|nr:universal stress protein [Spongiibacteraceae bacterium]